MRRPSFRDLVVWQKGMDMVERVYALTAEMPKSEDYALRGQMRRAAISIPANIAEGSGRGTDKDHVQFLRMALGSVREMDTLAEISRRVGCLRRSRIRASEPDERD